jgi:hypothetical protein
MLAHSTAQIEGTERFLSTQCSQGNRNTWQAPDRLLLRQLRSLAVRGLHPAAAAAQQVVWQHPAVDAEQQAVWQHPAAAAAAAAQQAMRQHPWLTRPQAAA